MKKATVPYCEGLDFKSYVRLPIDIFLWEKNGYAPKTAAYVCYNKNGIAFRLVSLEKPEYTVYEDGGDVFSDSCLEVFIRPFADDERYMNFEFNALGTTIICLGADRFDRTSVVKRVKPLINLSATKSDEMWQIEFSLPYKILCDLYDRQSFSLPNDIDINFYKCGEKTRFPHYGMWNEINNKTPDFHRKEFFGSLKLF